LVQQLAAQHNVAAESLLLAWLLRHPAGIQPVIGTAHPGRIRACGAALQVKLSREEWYRLYVTARGLELP
ncbi:MAG: aldo/keto reductase, partial [Aeromonadaceae bacterium]